MPETFTPFTWSDGSGGGTPITAAQLNRLETGLESMDDRSDALEIGLLDHTSRLDALAGVNNVGGAGASLSVSGGDGNGTVKLITLTAANCVFSFVNPVVSGRAYALELVLTQDATGGRTATWPSSVKWSGGAPVLSTAANAVDRLVFVSYDGGATWYGDLIGKAYA